MAEGEAPRLVVDADEVAAIAKRLGDAGWFALDLEFVSEGRYVPELCLIQVAWPDPDAGLAIVDAQAVDAAPIFSLISGDRVDVVTHAGRQDLALLATRYQVRATRFIDTQVASAFAGFGEQIGYARMIGRLLDVDLDKGPQFTDWSARPLSSRQLRYAAADVGYLRDAWPLLSSELVRRGRLAWVIEESAAVVADVSERTPPEEIYRSIGGWGGLRGPALGALVALAAWREREALATNKPPSWILPDSAVLELCKRRVSGESAMRRIRGIGAGTVRRYGEPILAALGRGAGSPVDPPRRKSAGLAAPEQALAQLIYALIQARCAHETLPPKLIGGRAAAEALVAWHANGAGEGADAVGLLSGWRRELIGDDAIALLRGQASLEIRGDRLELSSKRT